MIDILIARLYGLTIPCQIRLSYGNFDFTICAYDNPRINALWSDIYKLRHDFKHYKQLPDVSFECGTHCQSYILCEVDIDEFPQDGDILDFFKEILSPILLYFHFLFTGTFYVDRIIWFKPEGLIHVPYKINLYPPQEFQMAEDPLLNERMIDYMEPNIVMGVEDNFSEFYNSIQKYPVYLDLIEEFCNACTTKDSNLRLANMWICFEHMVNLFMNQEGIVLAIQDEVFQKLIKMVHEKLSAELLNDDIIFEGLQAEQICSKIIQELSNFRIKKAKGIPSSKIKELRIELDKMIKGLQKEPPFLTKEQVIDHFKRGLNNFPPIFLKIERVIKYFEQEIGDEKDDLFYWDSLMTIRKKGTRFEGDVFEVYKVIKKVKDFRDGFFHRGEKLNEYETNEFFKIFRIISAQLLLNLLRFINPIRFENSHITWNSPESDDSSVEAVIERMMKYTMRVESGPIVQTRLILEDLEKNLFMEKEREFQRNRYDDYLFGKPLDGEISEEDEKSVIISLKHDFKGIVRVLKKPLYFRHENSYYNWKSEDFKLKYLEEELKWQVSLNIKYIRRLTSLIPGKFCKFKTDKISIVNLS